MDKKQIVDLLARSMGYIQLRDAALKDVIEFLDEDKLDSAVVVMEEVVDYQHRSDSAWQEAINLLRNTPVSPNGG